MSQNVPGTPQANGAQGADPQRIDAPPQDPDPFGWREGLLDLIGAPVAVAQPEFAAATSQTQPTDQEPPTLQLSVDAENRLFDRLLSSLQELGVGQPRPTTPTAAPVHLAIGPTIGSQSQPEREVEERSQASDPWSNWRDPWSSDNNWRNWNWSSDNWQSQDWSG